jgi:hypothetical protein
MDCNMSSFLSRIKERSENERLSHIDYAGFRRMRALRAVTVRLPVTTIAKMKLLEEKCPDLWESRQEMLFEMIESCVQDWISTQPSFKRTYQEFDSAARSGLTTQDNEPDAKTSTKEL